MSEGRKQICEMSLHIRTHFSASLSLTWHQMVSDKLVFRERRQYSFQDPKFALNLVCRVIKSRVTHRGSMWLQHSDNLHDNSFL